MSDPTYIKSEIDKNQVWELAFTLSEIQNDNAPIGWGKYIPLAKGILASYEIKKKEPKDETDMLCPCGDVDCTGPLDIRRTAPRRR